MPEVRSSIKQHLRLTRDFTKQQFAYAHTLNPPKKQKNMYTHRHILPLVVGDFRHSSGDIRLVTSHHDFSFIILPFLTPSAGFWRKIFERDQKSTESVPRIFSPLFVWIVAHFSVMGNKMWFQACWRTWMIPVQNLEAWISRPTLSFLFFWSLIWIIDGFSEAYFHLPLNPIYHWHSVALKLVVDLKDLSCFLETWLVVGSWWGQFS